MLRDTSNCSTFLLEKEDATGGGRQSLLNNCNFHLQKNDINLKVTSPLNTYFSSIYPYLSLPHPSPPQVESHADFCLPYFSTDDSFL